MYRFMRAIRPGLARLSLACLYLAGLGVVAMTLIIGWQVFARYVLNNSPSWSEPLSLQLMSWFILLGAAVGVRESVHLGLDFVRHAMPPSIQRLMDLISLGLITVFGVAMSYYGLVLARGTWTATIPVLGWPGGVDFFPLVVGGIMIAIFALERFIDTLVGSQAVGEPSLFEVV
ncbi:TRAP transporter small permease [Rhizobium glycinendophyticum]|uniref:TRAP transporter small permease protein n=1 Tax=Rhizobium glycinendophyticum TaxID=2589807 RepID=A0A504TQN2_9HYPH|nr:TRAP transporter small permease [Rhizobium glycinendophyticum]TPP04644.1 TRAP transporter small permease [Rhizobium glycinendophyticum]